MDNTSKKRIIYSMIPLFGFGLIYSGAIQYLFVRIFLFAFLIIKSIITLENNGDNKIILKYWICYSIYSIFDTVGDFVFAYLPFGLIYHLFKFLFFLILFRAPDQSVTIIYDRLIRTQYRCNKKAIDRSVKQIENRIEKFRAAGEERTLNIFERCYNQVKIQLFDFIRDNDLFFR